MNKGVIAFTLVISLILVHQASPTKSTSSGGKPFLNETPSSQTDSKSPPESDDEETSDSEETENESEPPSTDDPSPNPDSNNKSEQKSNNDPSSDSNSNNANSSESDNKPDSSPDSNSNNADSPEPESDPSKENDSNSDEDGSNNDAEDSDNDDDSPNEIDKAPAMICALFGQTGCNAECRLRALMYGIYDEGICTKNQTCQCNNTPQPFYYHWDRRFHYDEPYTYRAILGDDYLYKKVKEIFQKNPLKTGKQYKEILKPILSPYEYSKLKVFDRTLAAKFTGDGIPDKEAIRKYIDERLNLLLKSSVEPLLTTNYKENFETTLKNTDNNGTLYNFSVKLNQLQNQTLNDIFEANFKKRKITKPEVNEQRKQNLDDVFEEVFWDYLIKKNNERNKVSKKSPQTKKRARNDAKSKPSEKSSPVKKQAPKKQTVKKGAASRKPSGN